MIACLYTWLNVNLNFTERSNFIFPNKLILHFTEDDLTGFLSKTEAISLFEVMFRKSKRKLTYLQIICKSVSFLDESRITIVPGTLMPYG